MDPIQLGSSGKPLDKRKKSDGTRVNANRHGEKFHLRCATQALGNQEAKQPVSDVEQGVRPGLIAISSYAEDELGDDDPSKGQHGRENWISQHDQFAPLALTINP